MAKRLIGLEQARLYARDHTVTECAKHFSVKYASMLAYIRYHKIEHKKRNYSGKANSNYKGGISKEHLYYIYHDIKKRCKDKENPWYGAKGIRVEFTSYLDFKTWALANDYAEGLSIDRINSNGNYSKENCRWVNARVQSNNTSRNVFIEYNNEKHTIAEWARLYAMSYSVLYHRLKIGWSMEKSLTVKVGYRCQK